MKTIDEEFISGRLRDFQHTHFERETAGSLKRASVLILFVWIEERWHIVYTRRTNLVENHKGQVSFPGGAEEKADIDAIATAVREANEEIGVPADCMRILGKMPVMPTHTGFLITPVVARMEWPIELVAAEAEVSRIFMVPLDWLADRENWEEREYQRPDGSRENVVFFKPYEGETVWGITGRITVILLQGLGLS